MKNTLFDKDNVSIKRELNSQLGRAGKIAINWLKHSPIYISTKTSGTGKFAQLIEIAILDCDQSVLFHSQIKPSVKIDDDMLEQHCIDFSSLSDRPSWSQVAATVQELTKDRRIIMFDVLFETRILKQSCIAHNIDFDWVDDLSIDCAMNLATITYGIDNRYGTTSIEYAMKKANITGYKADTGAVAATYAIIQLIKIIADYTHRLQAKAEKKPLKHVCL
jgi:DNA polymerase III epsilon subunit-like protein